MNSQMPGQLLWVYFFFSTLIIAVFINCNSYLCKELCVVIPQMFAVIVFGFKKINFQLMKWVYPNY